MKNNTKHLIIPAIVIVIFFILSTLPVELVSCRSRGMMAAVFAIAAGVLGIVAAAKALTGKVSGDDNSPLWMASAIILAVPAFFIVLTAT